jgi:hypothetical protein
MNDLDIFSACVVLITIASVIVFSYAYYKRRTR